MKKKRAKSKPRHMTTISPDMWKRLQREGGGQFTRGFAFLVDVLLTEALDARDATRGKMRKINVS